ncbi:non-structural maintenance of chromosomes element 1 homolog [Amyelois transitella]|uniref:non-structural maintenance of chromosomes element 1 homolog n=1 Tax=Amyelois transitella TaxID=680683 RepID=UPI00067C7BD2|nr:non-structural maintenance of chromosomes element 1 homolog [Amyelois transitella]
MSYGNVHRFVLRSIASRGVMSLPEIEEAIRSYSDDQVSSLEDMIQEINDKIRPFKQTIKLTNDELTNEEVVIFLSLGYDEATKAQSFFTATELEYFRVLMEQIMTTEARQITGIHALNLVGSMKSTFTKTDAQKLLDTWCRMRYLEKDENNYALGVRTIHEFEGYLRQNMPDTIEECCLCKQIVFRGYNCPSCGLAIHTRCLKRYLTKVDKWPCCKCDFNAEQLERLQSAEHSRLTQLPNETRRSDEDVPKEASQASTVVDSEASIPEETQEIIPEISQRVTRKRARPN